MRKTLFAGLTQLDPTDPLSSDDFSFQAVNPDITDRLLEVGCRTHRHDGHAALDTPVDAPVVLAVVGGGSIPSGVTIEFAYTFLDSDRGETDASPVAAATTDPGVTAPLVAPGASADYAAGSLQADTYYYGYTWVDADGGETELGPVTAVDVNPSSLAQVLLSGLITDMPGDAVAWRLYRARGGEDFHFLSEGSIDTETDDGTLCTDCDTHPPELNTTIGQNSIEVTIPAFPTGVVGYRLYGTVTSGQFDTFSFIQEGDIDETVVVTDFVPTYGRPPSRNLSIGGASLIDPDTELFDWHWKRPVSDPLSLPSGSLGDVRLATDDGHLYAILASAGAIDYTDWTAIASGVGGGSERHEGHTFAIYGTLTSGMVLPGMFVVREAGASAYLAKARYRLASGGASATIRKNGTPIAGYSNLPINTTPATTDAADVALALDDYVDVAVTALSAADTLSLTLDQRIDT